jgi:Ca-activated chloride channel family protein
MRLAHWPFLLLLVLIPLLHRWWSRRNRPARVTYSLPVPKSVARANPAKILMVLRYLALAMLVVALARPQTSFKQTERTVSGIDIMMVMDFSASMNIEDLAERSRFEIAKEMMESFIKGRNNDRIGLVIFSGEPLTLAPPTLDYGLVLRALKDAQIGVLKDGTGIGDGLSLAVNRLRNSTAKSKVIVLLTDGDNNVGQVDPATAGELAAGYGIRVYTIAIGKEGRVRMPIRHKGVFGNTVTTYQWFDNALNPELLTQIANRTNGKFYRVTDYDTLESVFKEIDQLEKVEVKSTEKVRYEENFQMFLKLGFFFFILGLLLERGWWRVLP